VKWFCSNIFRCLVAAISIALPFSIPTIYPILKIGGLDHFPTYIVYLFVGMALFLTLMLRVLGILSKKIHPPLTWKESDGRFLKLILNILLGLPFIGLARILILSNSHLIDFFLWTEISVVSTLVLYLLNRQVSNEDYELAKSQPAPVTAENMTPKQLRRMRIGALVQAGATIVLMTLYFRANFKLDDAERELLIHQYESTEITEKLQIQIDSLTVELNKKKQDTIANRLP
jgi:hypothetical protein